MTRLQLPHAIVVRLHVRKSNVVILTPETAVGVSSLSLSVGFSIQDEAMDVARSAPQGAHYHADVMALQSPLGGVALMGGGRGGHKCAELPEMSALFASAYLTQFSSLIWRWALEGLVRPQGYRYHHRQHVCPHSPHPMTVSIYSIMPPGLFLLSLA